MKPFKKKIFTIALAGVMAASLLAGCSGTPDYEEAVAVVGDEEIPLGVANFYARMQQAQYETYYASMMGLTGETMWSQEVGDGETYEESVKSSSLEMLEDMYLISQHAAEYEVALTEEDEAAIQDAADVFDEDNALEDKEAVGGYNQYVKKFLELVTIQSRMQDLMQAGVDEEVSDEEAAQKSMEYVYFQYTITDDSGTAVDMTDEEKTALQETVKLFLDSLNADETHDLSAVAAAGGVELQTATFDSESTSPTTEVVAAVDALENEGDVTGMIETDYGIYIAKLTSLLDREATDAEKATIVEERRQEQYDSLIAQWREETEITENERVWNRIKFEDLGVTIKQSEDQYDDSPTE